MVGVGTTLEQDLFMKKYSMPILVGIITQKAAGIVPDTAKLVITVWLVAIIEYSTN